jgi:hypothetical protein
VRDDQRFRLGPGVRVIDLLFLFGIVGLGRDRRAPGTFLAAAADPTAETHAGSFHGRHTNLKM